MAYSATIKYCTKNIAHRRAPYLSPKVPGHRTSVGKHGRLSNLALNKQMITGFVCLAHTQRELRNLSSWEGTRHETTPYSNSPTNAHASTLRFIMATTVQYCTGVSSCTRLNSLVIPLIVQPRTSLITQFFSHKIIHYCIYHWKQCYLSKNHGYIKPQIPHYTLAFRSFCPSTLTQPYINN